MNEARQITEENIGEIATWCGRPIGVFDDGREFTHHEYIRMNPDDIAVVGDWIVASDDKKFKAITDEEYLAILASEEKDTQRLQQVIVYVKYAMLQMAADGKRKIEDDDIDRVAEETAQKILEII